MARKKPRKADDTVAPTPEQFGHAEYERALLAYKRVISIKRLYETGKLSVRQYNGLDRYRSIAIADERSPMRDSLDKAANGRGGEGLGLPPSALRNAIELGRLERELRGLRDIARAIAVDDLTVSQWAMKQSGAVMRQRAGAGEKVITWFEPHSRAAKIALAEIRMAGEWLAAAIGA